MEFINCSLILSIPLNYFFAFMYVLGDFIPLLIIMCLSFISDIYYFTDYSFDIY